MAEDELINHTDVTTIMDLIRDLRDDVRRIRDLLEDENGETNEDL